ncbi:arsenate reductase family protein [Tissierella sp. MSJ-40]|uniref:Arsenate reductase family protein n=1 Tax=Tissierella simiarum TaxID=2841534 RepID=A0ABS6E3V0_9FIRM|nr:arsenate reductase family protein [Tissierella simiarum]MBU5437256.1 arsenate reductase family protein [Tissierella simiarum]
MEYLFICYSKCSTCKKAKKWLDDNNILYKERPINENNPTADELKEWIVKSGYPIKRFFNTSGNLYKELGLKDKLPNMSDDEKIMLLATDGMLVKRPILVGEDVVLVGFKEEEWNKILK